MAVDPSGTLLASGSFDNNLKVWGASLQERSDEADDEGGDSKRAKGGNQAVTRTPVMTLAGHKEGISGVCWEEDKSSVVTASWDHTIRVWDTEMGGMKTELVGNKSSTEKLFQELLTSSKARSYKGARENVLSFIKEVYPVRRFQVVGRPGRQQC